MLPQGLATFSHPNPFLLRTVHKRCNHTCGRHVDAPFLKSWAVEASVEQVRSRYTEVTAGSTLPLKFMGEMPVFAEENRVCDFWLGPAGDRIYHFHEAYEQDPHSRVAVGLPQWGPKQNFDPGFVFIVVNSGKELWQKVLLRSCFAEFPDSVFYLVNGPTPPGRSKRGQHFSDVPPELMTLRDRIVALNGEEHHARMTVYLDAPDRFMCKLALGYGALFMKPEFLQSADAQLLRDGLWERDPDKRAKLPIRGRKFLGEADPFAKTLNLAGCHILAGMPSGNRFALLLRLSGGESHCIAVSENPEHWRGAPLADGLMHVIAAGLQQCVGPLTMHEWTLDVVARLGGAMPRDARLAGLEARLAKVPPLPPFE